MSTSNWVNINFSLTTDQNNENNVYGYRFTRKAGMTILWGSFVKYEFVGYIAIFTGMKHRIEREISRKSFQ